VIFNIFLLSFKYNKTIQTNLKLDEKSQVSKLIKIEDSQQIDKADPNKKH